MNTVLSGSALCQITPPAHISSAHIARKEEIMLKANVAAHQKKENKNANKNETGEERRQGIDFREFKYCLSAVVHRVARRKDD